MYIRIMSILYTSYYIWAMLMVPVLGLPADQIDMPKPIHSCLQAFVRGCP